MLLVKRLLWLLAWGVWLWLGVGLYRELPRELGPMVSQLPVGSRDTLLGFVGGSDEVAVLVGDEDRYGCRKVGLFDARTGDAVGSPVGPQPFRGRHDDWDPL